MNSKTAAKSPELPCILGMQLRPLSIGHLILLQRAKSSFLKEWETPPSLEDLLFALSVCSRRTFSAKRHIELPWFKLWIRVKAAFWQVIAVGTPSIPVDWVHPQLITFAEYLSDGLDAEVPSFCGELGLTQMAILQRVAFVKTIEEAFDIPFLEAFKDGEELKRALASHKLLLKAIQEYNAGPKRTLGLEK